MSRRHDLPILSAAMGLALIAGAGAAGASGPTVYIPTGENAEVVVIDAQDGETVATIAGLPAAHGLAVTPDGDRVIVGSFDERVPGSEAPEKPAGISEADHAAHHGGKPKATAETGVSSVSIIDAATHSLIRRIDVPGAVHHVAVNPDSSVAAVTHPNTGAITAIDLETSKVIRTVETGAMPNYAAFSLEGDRLYVSNSGDNSISVLDTRTWTVTARIDVGESPEHLVLAPDGRRLLVNNVIGGSVSVVDLTAETVIDTLLVGDTPHGIDISDDGSTIFVALRGEDTLAAIDLETGARRNAPLSPGPYHLAAIRGAGVLYVSSAEESRVWVVDAATLEVRGELAVPGIGHQFGQAPGS